MIRNIVWITLVVAVLFTILDPAATEGTPPLPRLLQWLVQVSLGLTILISVHRFWQRASPRFAELPGWLAILLSGGLGSLLFTPFAIAIDIALGLDQLPAERLPSLVVWYLSEVAMVAGPMILIWLVVNVPVLNRLDLLEPRVNHKERELGVEHDPTDKVRETEQDQLAAPPKAKPALFRRLPARVGTDVIYLKSELHYLLVVTDKGNCLVLYNLRDAIEELEPYATGIQTHRSYWAAKRHFREFVKSRDTVSVLLNGDHRVPVSRRNIAKVKRFFLDL